MSPYPPCSWCGREGLECDRQRSIDRLNVFGLNDSEVVEATAIAERARRECEAARKRGGS